jgi:hypothetical protein
MHYFRIKITSFFPGFEPLPEWFPRLGRKILASGFFPVPPVAKELCRLHGGVDVV